MRRTWAVGILVAVSAAVYWPTLKGAFVWDDETQLVKNPAIRSVSRVGKAFTTGFWSFASGGVSRNNFYRPVQTVLYTAGYAAGGLNPTAYHAINISLHAAATLAVYWLCLELEIGSLWALLAAALFAVHPVHSEAVAWIAGVPDVACAVSYFASAAACLRWDRTEQREWLGLSLGLFLAALLSKEMAVTLPLFLALLMPSRWRRLGPYMAVLAIYVALRVNALGFLSVDQVQASASWWDWLTLGVFAWGAYFWYVIVPYPLSAYHTIPLHFDDRAMATGLAALALLGAAAAAWLLRKRIPEIALWLGAFTLMLTPVFYFKGISTALIAERYLYIPSVAAILLLVSLARRVSWGRWPVAAIAIVFAALTVGRLDAWKGSEALYETTIATSPDAAHIRLNLAAILLDVGAREASKTQVQAALKILDRDKYVQTQFDRYRATVAMGVLESEARNYAEARRFFEEAIKVDPEGDWAHLYLGRVMLEADGDFAGGLEHIRKAVSLSDVNEVARDLLGVALFNLGDHAGAIAAFEEALKINPQYAPARQHLDRAR